MICDSDQLAAFTAGLQHSDWVAVDTEFLRERTYYPKLCLVQIASDTEVGLIDTLAIDDLEPLARLLDNSAITKVFHAADQDLEVLQYRLGVLPAPVLDTQIAAALTGMGDQIGYGHMIETVTGIRLAKDQTRTDWSQRPLSRQAQAYAADDVRYLASAFPVLRAQLKTLGRHDWAHADSDTLVDKARQPVDASKAWRRIRAWRKLNPGQQQVLAALAQWREIEAMRANRPRRWILSDDALLTLSRQRPDSEASLASLKEVPRKIAQRHGAALLHAIQEGVQRPATPLAADPGPMTDEQKQKTKTARQVLSLRAKQTGIPAPTLAKRRELEQIARGERDVGVLYGWRAEVVGHAIVAVIEGQRHIVGSGDSAQII